MNTSSCAGVWSETELNVGLIGQQDRKNQVSMVGFLLKILIRKSTETLL